MSGATPFSTPLRGSCSTTFHDQLADDHGDVGCIRSGRKSFHHPDVGDLDLGYQSMSLNGTPGQALIAYYAKPGTAEHDALTLLDRADIDQHQLPTEQTETIDAPHPKRSDSNRDSNAAET